MIQADEEEKDREAEAIPRLKVIDMREEELPSTDIIPYIGSKNPEMPDNEA